MKDEEQDVQEKINEVIIEEGQEEDPMEKFKPTLADVTEEAFSEVREGAKTRFANFQARVKEGAIEGVKGTGRFLYGIGQTALYAAAVGLSINAFPYAISSSKRFFRYMNDEADKLKPEDQEEATPYEYAGIATGLIGGVVGGLAQIVGYLHLAVDGYPEALLIPVATNTVSSVYEFGSGVRKKLMDRYENDPNYIEDMQAKSKAKEQKQKEKAEAKEKRVEEREQKKQERIDKKRQAKEYKIEEKERKKERKRMRKEADARNRPYRHSSYDRDITNIVQSVFQTGMTLACVAAIGGCIYSCKPVPDELREPYRSNYSIRQHKVDQVFRDHTGYRVYFTGHDGQMLERKYSLNGGNSYGGLPIVEEGRLKDADRGPNVKIFKDLEAGKQGYADVVRYQDKTPWYENGVVNMYYVEVHLPADQGINPGIDTTGGKNPRHPQMGEIK